ncbi:hypothetical protein GCM10022228_12200 [Halomonas cibimaris]|uniref:Flagellar hook-associated protein 1 n=1 Tax=Halomonas cibimaris TaxID=657012 RepID=A0ABP7LK70_9GAMM
MSMFSTGLSGLNAAQNALQTTSNNISNVFTPGYNREITQLGEGSVGSGGVRVNDIERQFNQYVATQLNSAKSESSALETYASQVSQIDNLLADREAGLAPLMQGFFSSLEDLASAPSDPAARQGVLGSADTMSAQFRSFDGYLQDMQGNINGQIEDEVTQINNATKQIAHANREISLARARTGEAPNSLLNQRDRLVSELNERMDLRLNVQDGKTYNVSLPNGQPLVTGTDSFKLEAMQSDADPQRTVVGYRDGGGNLVELEEDTVQGGSLGGLMSFRSETLDKTQNQIGQLAVSLSMTFNEQHRMGVDLDGNQGENFFNVREPQAYSGSNNTANVDAIRFDNGNIDQLRATDYTVTMESGSPVVTRNDNGAEVDSEWDSGTNTLSFGGVEMTFSGTPAADDTFEVQPVRRAGAGMETAIGDLDKIAAALGPVQPMPYDQVDFQGQSEDRLGETGVINEELTSGEIKKGVESGLEPFAFIPTGAKNVTIHLYDRGADDDIQLFTRDGKHLIGTPVEGTDADPSVWEGKETDYTWKNNADGIIIKSANDVEENIFTLINGFDEGTKYDSSHLLNRKDKYSADLSDPATSNYADMNFTYTGDGNRFDTSPNDLSTDTNYREERVNIDEVKEPLFLLVSGNGRFDIKATWDDMPGTPGTGGVNGDSGPIGQVQGQLEVSDIEVAPAFQDMDSDYRPPSFAVKAADDGSLSLGFFGADSDNNLFVSPDAGSVPSNPPPEGVFSVYKEDGSEIDNVLSVNSGGADTLAPGERLTIKDDATGKTVLSFTVDQLPTGGTSGVTFTGRTGTTGPGDNRNALALQDLQSEDLVAGSATLSGAYGAMVSDVGNRTNITQVNLEARQGLTDQLEAVQQSESGVNFDEEAANLVKYQQFYQANAKVIDTASSVMDTILNLR